MGYMQQGMPPQGQQQQQQQHHQQVAPAPPVMEQQIPIEEEPPSKKLRSEDHLLAEAQFLELHKVCLFILWIIHKSYGEYIFLRVPLPFKYKFRLLAINRNGG